MPASLQEVGPARKGSVCAYRASLAAVARMKTVLFMYCLLRSRPAGGYPARRLEAGALPRPSGVPLRYRDSQMGQVMSYRRLPYSDNPWI